MFNSSILPITLVILLCVSVCAAAAFLGDRHKGYDVSCADCHDGEKNLKPKAIYQPVVIAMADTLKLKKVQNL